MNIQFNSLAKQKGVAILVISVLMLLLVTLVTLYSSQSLGDEQQISSQDYRARQAFEAAQAGMEYALANLQQNPSIRNGTFPTAQVTSSVCASGGSPCYTYKYNYTQPNALTSALIQINSTGFSDDQAAKSQITQQVEYITAVGHIPPQALVAAGAVDMGGNMTISNLTTNNSAKKTIRSGGNVSISGSAGTKIMNGTNTKAVTGSNKTSIGSDVTQNDTALSSLSTAQFFQSFFNASETSVYNTVDAIYSTGSAVSAATSDSSSPLSGWHRMDWCAPRDFGGKLA